MEDLDYRSLLQESSVSYEEAKKRNEEENTSFSKAKYFNMSKDGKYSVRILPIVPTIDTEGKPVIDRKGYEYPLKEIFLKIENPKATSKKNSLIQFPVCNTSYVGYQVDLIDTYVRLVKEKCDDEKIVEKVTGNSFGGGLKWNSERCAYVYDNENRKEGLQILKLSYSQYKDLEERKLELWNKLLKKDSSAPCPISSFNGAYIVEITRKNNGSKTEYSFNIDVISGVDELSDEEIAELFKAPRLPEPLYRYSRYHFEATIEFLKQYDEKMGLSIMNTKEMKDAIQQLNVDLPSDDKSHFSFDKKDSKEAGVEANTNEVTIDTLWDEYEAMQAKNLGDKTEEGIKLREAIKAYINDNELSVRITHAKTNEDLLNDIEDAFENDKSDKVQEEIKPEPAKEPEPEPVEEDEEEEEAEAPAPEPKKEVHTRHRTPHVVEEPEETEEKEEPKEEASEESEEEPSTMRRPRRRAR